MWEITRVRDPRRQENRVSIEGSVAGDNLSNPWNLFYNP